MIAEVRLITVEEYHKMGEAGVISTDEKVELIEGKIIKKPMKGTSYAEVRLITVEEYHKMGEAGVISTDEEVELIEGKIIEKPMKGTTHSAINKYLEKLLESCLGDAVLVRVQDPVKLDNYSEPEPDIAVVKPDDFYYATHHPTPPEIYLIVEIADTTLKRDTEFKAKVYGKAGINDYWVLDITNRQLYAFREPTETGYQNQQILSNDATISPVAFPNVTINISEMLRPLTSIKN
jgi:Uma2 family endonuclease